MLTYQIALTFFGIAIVLALTPGPDNLFVLMQSALGGRNAGLWVVLGLCTGLVGHTAAVAAGLAAVFAASATAFTVLKLAGAVYLLYLAWGAWCSHGHSQTGSQPGNAALTKASTLYRRGIIMNLTNPKVSLFFLAFLPQFTSPLRGSVALQTLSLGALFMLATLLVFGSIALFSGAVGIYLQKTPKAQLTMNRIAALVFVGLAIKLALVNR
ncbi:MAG: LysE family translocator [Burkholderiaceae bacterium]|nr:LysE family translocator [Burkholderiaceae bacterium]